MTTIYFATNRNPNRKKDPDSFGTRFNPDSIDNLRFGKATVEGNKIKSLSVSPERLSTIRKEQIQTPVLFNSLKRRMQTGIDTLAFIHGYNVSFTDSLIVAGRLEKAYSKHYPLSVVLFSWPSDGSMMPFLAYKRDRTDAAASGPALARAFLKLRDFLSEVRRSEECNARIHLMAHSMGNYVLRHGIQEIRRHTAGDLPCIFDQVFLMAADEDHDAFEFEYKLKLLPDLCTSVNVYFNTGDTALVISDRTKSNPTRLGSRGPREPLNVPGNVTTIDVSDVVKGPVEHSYFWENKETVRDVSAVLKGTPPDQFGNRRRYVASQNRYVLMK